MRFLLYTHSLVSDWNHGNAHFLRGVLRELAALGADACLRLNRAMISLADDERRKETAALCLEIDEIESKGDKVLKKAITRLFAEGTDPWMAMKLHEFYFLLETVLDRCEETAKTIEEILIENS